MLTQGATLVRLVNKLLAEDGQNPDFVLMTIYLKSSGTFSIYFLFQVPGETNNFVRNNS